MAFEFGSKFKILLPVPLNRGRGSLFVPVLKGLWQKKNIPKNNKKNNQNESYNGCIKIWPKLYVSFSPS